MTCYHYNASPATRTSSERDSDLLRQLRNKLGHPVHAASQSFSRQRNSTIFLVFFLYCLPPQTPLVRSDRIPRRADVAAVCRVGPVEAARSFRSIVANYPTVHDLTIFIINTRNGSSNILQAYVSRLQTSGYVPLLNVVKSLEFNSIFHFFFLHLKLRGITSIFLFSVAVIIKATKRFNGPPLPESPRKFEFLSEIRFQ